MPCQNCRDPARCDRMGVCQSFRFTLPAPCRPGSLCERSKSGEGCEAGRCNPPGTAGVDAAHAPACKQAGGCPDPQWCCRAGVCLNVPPKPGALPAPAPLPLPPVKGVPQHACCAADGVKAEGKTE